MYSTYTVYELYNICIAYILHMHVYTTVYIYTIDKYIDIYIYIRQN